MSENTYGYVRVSTREQNEDRQIVALREVDVAEKTSLWISSPVRILTDRNIGSSCGK